ncbi:MAG: PEP-CTERM sorting domain-containing protein [Myxococcota bacterium]
MKLKNRIGTLAGLSMAGLVCWGSAASAMTRISEVYYDAPGSDDGQLFVELSGTPGASLEGFTLEGINGTNGAAGPTILLGGAIRADGLFLIADTMSDGSTNVADADWTANFDFQNGPDSVRLRFGEEVYDALGYGVFDPDEIFAGEGSAAPDAPAGSSLARVFANLDTGDNSVDFQILSDPTPGAAAFSPVPEPGTALLLGLGLATLAGSKRSGADPDWDLPFTAESL